MINSSINLRVEKVQVSGLFGLYDHEILLNAAERVTILHGPNGVGKSVVLRLIAAFFDGRYQEFAQIRYTNFKIRLSNGCEITIQLSPIRNPLLIGGQDVQTSFVEVLIASGENEEIRYGVSVSYSFVERASQIERMSPYLTRIGEGLYYDYRFSAKLTAEDVVKRYGTTSDISECIKVEGSSEPEAAKAIRKSVSVQLVETQRLLKLPPESPARSDRKQMIATVKSYSENLSSQISQSLSSYGNESTKLDQTFPVRLIRSALSVISALELKERLAKIDEQHSLLISLGIIDQSYYSYPVTKSEIDALDSAKLSAMALVVEDLEKKLRVLDDLARRITLLRNSVNGKFRNKSLSVHREYGFQIKDVHGDLIPLEALSSGEQHELVLWYDLLFRVRTNTLVLIDEPELSLHVTWQKKFLPELLAIAKTVPFDALLATHSPFIIGDRLDLAIPLDAEVDG